MSRPLLRGTTRDPLKRQPPDRVDSLRDAAERAYSLAMAALMREPLTDDKLRAIRELADEETRDAI